MDLAGPLVDEDWLRSRIDAPGVLVVDCRFALGDPGAGERSYLDGHIPGARFLDVDRDLAAPPGDGGRHPLPGAAEFERAARRAGIAAGSLVVAYDQAGEGGAARLWWLLRHFGHARVALLDGGLAAWRAAGAPLERGRPEPPVPGDFEARERTDDVAPLDEVRERALARDGSLTLVDVRASERYRGEVEPIDPVAGHIPGAANLPFASLAPGGRFLPAGELRDRLAAAGVRPGADAVAYCGSGITATVLIAAATAAGIDGVRLYPGAWSEWSRAGLPPAPDGIER
jgi:thiosulfate/3-mercaptopyruvate sulfurtransferase